MAGNFPMLTRQHSDIIDTEPSSGDVNKMLLGSFVEEYDEDDEGESGRWVGSDRQMESPRAISQQLSSPVRTSPFGPSSPSSQAAEVVVPTINPFTPPTRQQTRTSSGGLHDPFDVPHIQYARHEAR
jgi:hypothetical protein